MSRRQLRRVRKTPPSRVPMPRQSRIRNAASLALTLLPTPAHLTAPAAPDAEVRSSPRPRATSPAGPWGCPSRRSAAAGLSAGPAPSRPGVPRRRGRRRRRRPRGRRAPARTRCRPEPASRSSCRSATAPVAAPARLRGAAAPEVSRRRPACGGRRRPAAPRRSNRRGEDRGRGWRHRRTRCGRRTTIGRFRR